MTTTGKQLKSVLGKSLIRELKDKSADIHKVIDYVTREPHASRLKDQETGNTAYHLLLNGDFTDEFILTVLRLLLEKCPRGAQDLNGDGSLPLHVALRQRHVIESAVLQLIEAYPAGAKVEMTDPKLIPLFLAVMRDDASIKICRALCKVYPEGASTRNRNNSFPIHFACKRNKPNIDIMQLLISLYPAALPVINAYGWHPLHCLCTSSDNSEACRIVHEAYPEAVSIKDRQGRTCLHLATLLVGQDHQSAVAREEETIRFEREQQALLLKTVKNAKGSDRKALQKTLALASQNGQSVTTDELEDEDSDDDVGIENLVDDTVAVGTRSRDVVKYLISVYPQALCIQNNFNATPVETVVEKARKTQSKFKKVLVWGLFDDPVTARLLLLAQRSYARNRTLPPLRLTLQKVLYDLNWQARRLVLLASFGGALPVSDINVATSLLQVGQQLKEPAKTSNKHEIKKQRSKLNKGTDVNQLIVAAQSRNDGKNVLARLRLHGLEVCVRLIISYV